MLITLGHHLADSTLFALVVGVLCLCVSRFGAATRHALWLIAAAKFVLPTTFFSWLGESLGGLLPASHIVAIPVVVSEWVISPLVSKPSDVPIAASFYPLIFFCIWIVGSAVAFAIWLPKLWNSRRACECSCDVEQQLFQCLKQRIGLQRSVTLRVSDTVREPALVGFWNPVVIIPTGMAQQLSAAELESVILHELAHAKRGDNWTGAFAHAVTCVFWFYPVSWWIETRLQRERELACDEMVIRCGAAPEDYVAGILKVCRFHLREDLAGISGVSGSNLKNRMETIMSCKSEGPLLRIPKVLVASLIAAIVGVPLLIGFATSSEANARGGEVPTIVIRCFSARQPSAPVRLPAVTFGVKKLLLGAQLKNIGARPIVRYRIGWVVVFSGGNTEVTLGPATNVPAAIAPGGVQDVPAQGDSINPLLNKGARELVIFVNDIEFASGERWQADVSSVEKQAQEDRAAAQSKSQEPITCVAASIHYPEGTVIQVGNGSEQMCVRVEVRADPKNPDAGLTYIPSWIVTSEAARQRSATVVHLPAPRPVYCSPEPPRGGGLCYCEGEGEFSPGARVNSAKGSFQLRCVDGNWVQTSTPNKRE